MGFLPTAPQSFDLWVWVRVCVYVSAHLVSWCTLDTINSLLATSVCIWSLGSFLLQFYSQTYTHTHKLIERFQFQFQFNSLTHSTVAHTTLMTNWIYWLDNSMDWIELDCVNWVNTNMSWRPCHVQNADNGIRMHENVAVVHMVAPMQA